MIIDENETARGVGIAGRMRSPAMPSMDQLLVLLAVVEARSFAAAAGRLGRATSAISYAVDTLETHLGLPLFDRGTARKPKLTAAVEGNS
jgi:DNA-binding transcriptional LysR family regulator